MSASSQADGVRALAEPLAASVGLVVEDVTVTPAGRRRVLRVVVDLPADRTGGVPMDSVAQASQALSAALDTSNVMGGAPYVLEVSSPGVDRPLTERRHWSRARGRLVRVSLAAGAEASGRLTAVDEQALELDGERRIGWDEVRRGRVEVEFSRPGDDEDAEPDGAAEFAGEAEFDGAAELGGAAEFDGAAELDGAAEFDDAMEVDGAAELDAVVEVEGVVELDQAELDRAELDRAELLEVEFEDDLPVADDAAGIDGAAGRRDGEAGV